MPGGFQTQVYNQEAQAVPGDRASLNPIATFDAGPGGLVADPSGIIIGNFAWTTPPTDPDGQNTLATQVAGSGVPAGFAYNWTQALNTVFLSDASMLIPQGLPVALATQGDFWVTNSSASGAVQPGMKAYATFGTGAVTFAATASPTTTATSTASTISAQTFSVTGSIQNDILTVTAVGSGTVVVGGIISGTGISTGTQVTSQISGTAGGVGVYTISPSQQKSIASGTVSGTYGLLTIGGTVTGTYRVGQVISGGTTSAGTVITALGTGTGGAGTYIVNNTQTVASAALNAAGNVETKWAATSAGVPGALIRISSWG
jgi:hypothetical protein